MSGKQCSKRIYLKFNYPGAVPGSKTLLTGIRGKGKVLYITGFYEPPSHSAEPVISFLYVGDETGRAGPGNLNNSWNVLGYPNGIGRTVVSTNLYGPMIIDEDHVRIVGNYTTEESGGRALGCMYEGHINGSGKWTTLTPSDETINTIAHSTMGDLVVGNYDTRLIQGKAFIYDVVKKVYHDLTKPKALSITAYGIWHNKDHHYTIAGGFTTRGLNAAYLVDWNNKTQTLSNWREYQYQSKRCTAKITHFDGITTDNDGGYNLTGDAVLSNGDEVAFFVNYNDDVFQEEIKVPCSTSTSGNSVYKTKVIGVYKLENSETVNGYLSIEL